MGAGGLVKLLGRREERDAAILMQDRMTMQDRVARHIGTTDVQKPAQGVGQGQHRRSLTRLHQRLGQPRALGCRRFACQSLRMGKGTPHRRIGLIGPDPVHHVVARAQRHTTALQTGLQPRDLIGGVQPRVKADHAL